MKQLLTSTLACLILASVYGQGLVQIGDNAPKYTFTKLVNAPLTQAEITELKGKPIALVFWGTWCAPCIPEMINLAKLQKQFANKIQIIAVSNDDEQKLKYFLQKRPSKIWFASDPSQNLWNIFGISSAGHIALIDQDGKIVTVAETHLIDSTIIQNLIDKKTISLQENRGDKFFSINEDPIRLDSSTMYSFIVQPQLPGMGAMVKRPNSGAFAKRRITIINLDAAVIFREAFGISCDKRIVYATSEDSINSSQTILCVDFVVSDNDKSNLITLFQDELNNHLPFKAGIQKRIISCYVLRPIVGKQLSINESATTENKFSYNGLEFEGKGVPVKTFISYIENELDYPIYDATGLTKYYDIEFSRNNIEPFQSTKESLAKLGLELVKDQKEMDVLVISGR